MNSLPITLLQNRPVVNYNRPVAQPQPQALPPLFVRDKSRYVKIDPSDILWVEAEDNYATLQCREKSYLVSCNLKAMEERLHPSELIRIHRSFMVNLQRIDAIEDNIVQIGGKLIPIGRTYREALMKRLRLL